MKNEKKIRNDLIDLIKKNHISSVEAADALNKTGAISGVTIFNPGHFIVGKVKYVYTHSESNWALHEQIIDIDEDVILYIDAFNCNNKAVCGDIVLKYLFLYKGVKAVVVNGFLRDAHRLRKENYPIWLKGVTPIGCFNKKVEPPKEIERQIEKQKILFNNNVMICDDSGCTLINKDNINNQFYKNLEAIELQEDIWYYCIDTLKWSTFETICLKNYLKDKKVLPSALIERLNSNI
ncbi:MAG: RraA family protein [Deltaproteobacteria bacterium]|nr:RraA family protein [Deltaproteobacteria bacterium]